LFYILGT